MIRELREEYWLDAAAKASVAAGPIFCTAAVLASLYLQIPKVIIITPGEVLGFLFILLPAMFVGAILSILPNIIGTWVLIQVSKVIEAARQPFAWWLTGGMSGGAIALAFDATTPEVAFALIATSTICAAVCRARLEK